MRGNCGLWRLCSFMGLLVINAVFSEGFCPQWDASCGGSFFCVSTEMVTWSEAKVQCTQLGGHLVVPNNEDKWKHVKTLARGTPHWIGLSKPEGSVREGTVSERRQGWTWVDGSPYTTSWHKWWTDTNGEYPLGLSECIHANPSGFWMNNLYCFTMIQYICEAPGGFLSDCSDIPRTPTQPPTTTTTTTARTTTTSTSTARTTTTTRYVTPPSSSAPTTNGAIVTLLTTTSSDGNHTIDTANSDQEAYNNLVLYVVAGILGTLLLFAIIVVSIYVYRRKKAPRKLKTRVKRPKGSSQSERSRGSSRLTIHGSPEHITVFVVSPNADGEGLTPESRDALAIKARASVLSGSRLSLPSARVDSGLALTGSRLSLFHPRDSAVQGLSASKHSLAGLRPDSVLGSQGSRLSLADHHRKSPRQPSLASRKSNSTRQMSLASRHGNSAIELGATDNNPSYDYARQITSQNVLHNLDISTDTPFYTPVDMSAIPKPPTETNFADKRDDQVTYAVIDTVLKSSKKQDRRPPNDQFQALELMENEMYI